MFFFYIPHAVFNKVFVYQILCVGLFSAGNIYSGGKVGVAPEGRFKYKVEDDGSCDRDQYYATYCYKPTPPVLSANACCKLLLIVKWLVYPR